MPAADGLGRREGRLKPSRARVSTVSGSSALPVKTRLPPSVESWGEVFEKRGVVPLDGSSCAISASRKSLRVREAAEAREAASSSSRGHVVRLLVGDHLQAMLDARAGSR